MRISAWSSDVCSSDLAKEVALCHAARGRLLGHAARDRLLGHAARRLAASWNAGRARSTMSAVAVRQTRKCCGVCRTLPENGRASCRERECQYVYISGVAATVKTKQKHNRRSGI